MSKGIKAMPDFIMNKGSYATGEVMSDIPCILMKYKLKTVSKRSVNYPRHYEISEIRCNIC